MGEFTVVATFPTFSLAQVAFAALEAAGVEAFYENAELVNMDWMLGNAVGDVKLLVPTGKIDEAKSIIDRHRAQARERYAREREGADPEPERCLACGALFPVDAVQCPECQWSFDVGDAESVDEEE